VQCPPAARRMPAADEPRAPDQANRHFDHVLIIVFENQDYADVIAFNFPSAPSALVDAFRKYYGPTMNAFEAAEKTGRAADLAKELEDLFDSHNKSPSKDATSIPATFLRVTVAL